MKTILTSGRAEILIEREKEGMGVCFSGPLPDSTSPEFKEAYELLEGLVEYLEDPEKSQIGDIKDNLTVDLIPLPDKTPSWIITDTPYTWKGCVIVSQDSLRYYETLHKILLKNSEYAQSELLQIIYLKRAASCKDIINGLYKALGKISGHQE